MQYKHEYIISDLSDMLNMILSYPVDGILEEEYVIKAIDDCVKKSCPSINDLYNKFSKIIFAIYCLSEELQRARINATLDYCQNIVCDNSFYVKLTVSYYLVKRLIEINQLKNTNTNFRTEIICMLCSAPFKYIHQLHMFRRTVNELFLIKKKENQEALKILGYYLHKHKYMSETRDDFSSDEDYISAVLRVIRNNYNHYENIIYNIVSLNIEHIFKYKKLDSTLITFDRIVSLEKLGLEDSEVNLIIKAYRLYVSSLSRLIY